MKLEVDEVFKKLELAFRSRADAIDFSGIEVIPLSLSDGEERFNNAMYSLSIINEYAFGKAVKDHPSVFPVMVKCLQSIHDLSSESLDPKRFIPVFETSRRIITSFEKRHLEIISDVCRLVESAFSFRDNVVPNSFYLAKLTFYNSWLHHLSHKELLDFVRESTSLLRENQDTREIFGCTLIAHASSYSGEMVVSSNPYLTSVFKDFPRYVANEISKITPAPGSLLCSKINDAASELIKLGESDVKITVLNTDYLLVSQALEIFRKAHVSAVSDSWREKYVQASSILVNLITPNEKELYKGANNLYTYKFSSSVYIGGLLPGVLLSDIYESMSEWKSSPEFSSVFSKFRLSVLGSTLYGFNEIGEHRFGRFAKQVLTIMFYECKDDLLTQDFQDRIGRSGREIAADFVCAIGDLGDDSFKTDFLKSCKDARGRALENNLGL